MQGIEGPDVHLDQIRGDLAIQTLIKAVEQGYQVALVDGGSSPDFTAKVQSFGIHAIPQENKGMAASRRQVLNAASSFDQTHVIAWVEPEKVGMMDVLSILKGRMITEEADMVIPSRTEAGYNSYPQQQAKSEKQANRFFNKVLRVVRLFPEKYPDLDAFFGPRVFRNTPEMLELFTAIYDLKDHSKLAGKVKPDNYLNATFFPIVLALARGKKVIGVPVDYMHPSRQTVFENGKPEFEQKRTDQKWDIIRGTVDFARYVMNTGKTSALDDTSERSTWKKVMDFYKKWIVVATVELKNKTDH